MTRYDQWIREGRIPFSSKVVPIHESLQLAQWVLPTNQAIEILLNARSLALTDCICRSRYQRCDNPLDVCILLDGAADKQIEQGRARPISLEEAKATLIRTDEKGLVHLTIYNPDQGVYAICSCCSCCCHELQLLKKYGRRDLVAKSEYVARTDMEACTHCGSCVERCVFEARTITDRGMQQYPDKCYGCGLCVIICPQDAIVMERRMERNSEV